MYTYFYMKDFEKAKAIALQMPSQEDALMTLYLIEKNPEILSLLEERALSKKNLALVHFYKGRWQEAEKKMNEALEEEELLFQEVIQRRSIWDFKVFALHEIRLELKWQRMLLAKILVALGREEEASSLLPERQLARERPEKVMERKGKWGLTVQEFEQLLAAKEYALWEEWNGIFQKKF